MQLSLRTLAFLLLAGVTPACVAETEPLDLGSVGDETDPETKSPKPVGRDDEAPETPAPPSPSPEPVEADIESIAWRAGDDVGLGVASKDTGNPRGNSAALIYGGYQSTIENVKGWATALYNADLKERGVRHLFAIQGPRQVAYTDREIGNTKIVAALLERLDEKSKFVLMLGHSSGSYVAHELLNQVSGGGRDPDGKLNDRLVYFNLDGGYAGFNATTAAKVRRTYFVIPRDGTRNLDGFNPGDMRLGARNHPGVGGVLDFDASGAGCMAGNARNGCIHNALLISQPHNPRGATPAKDYDDFSGGRSVVTKYIADKAAEAGLTL